MLSVIIPARNEKYLEHTIRNVLKNARGDIEILVMLDGWIPEPQINVGDDRVIFHHFPTSIGQRQVINEGARRAKGEFVMKLDAHCAVDEGFDVKLAKDCEYEWTVIPRMYNLDINTFLPKRHKLTDYMYIGLRENGELRAEYYSGEEHKRQHKNKTKIDDIMCCMGPCFFMHKKRFWELGGCDETHGGWGQQGIEVACKAWLSGGALKVNKNTWFAHWFRGGQAGGFPYPISSRVIDVARKYSKDLWLNDKWPGQTRKFKWLVEKFQPPGWDVVPDLSIIIPSYKDIFLYKTINGILNNFQSNFEIIPVIDGYTLPGPLPVDYRIKPVFLTKNVGMRGAINAGIKAATGKYLMRSDEHCMYPEGFDKAILKKIENNWIVVPRRYYLDPYQWRVMHEKGYVDYEKLVVKENPKKFTSVKWIGRTKERRAALIDETMAMQGSCWIMSREWWDKVIQELQSEGYGPHYQDTTEMLFKTWKAGGKLMLNKTTWYAHKHREFNRTHQYPVERAKPEWLYALNTWQREYEEIKAKWKV